MTLFHGDGDYTMRAPCPGCSHELGRVVAVNGQDTVRCTRCNRHCYNAPRTETGRAERTVTTVHAGIKPKQRARILERANATCELCHHADKPIHVAHTMSVIDCLAAGVPDEIANSDANLLALCDECNLGLGRLTIHPRLYVAILMARFKTDALRNG